MIQTSAQMFQGIINGMEIVPYGALLTAHIGAFVVNITLVILADALGLLWAVGYWEALPRAPLMWLHRLVGLGLAVSIATGALLFWASRDYLLTVPAFYVKVALVAALVVNSFVIGRHLAVATSQPFASLESSEKRRLFLSAGVSFGGWFGVIIAAQFLGL